MNARELFSVESFSELLAYPFNQPGWQKRYALLTVLLAGLLLVPPFGEIVEMGVAYAAARQTAAEGRPSLPARLDRIQVLRDGLLWWLASLVFNLPSLLILLAGAAAGIALSDIPQGPLAVRLPALLRQAPFWVSLLAGLVIALPVGSASNFCLYVALTHAAHQGTFRAVLRVREWGRVLRAGLPDFARGWLSLAVLGLGLQIIQYIVSVPTAPLIIGPLLAAAFLGLYRRLISTAAVSLLYRYYQSQL